MGKIKLGISSCLLGNAVRYDGEARLNAFLRDEAGQYVAWAPVCPECEFGLPVPREKITLRPGAVPGEFRLETLDGRHDLTAAMREFCRARAELLRRAGLQGFVFKGKSPSCGLDSAAVRDDDNRETARADGVFAAVWKEVCPDSWTVEAESLESPAARAEFLERLRLLAER